MISKIFQSVFAAVFFLTISAPFVVNATSCFDCGNTRANCIQNCVTSNCKPGEPMTECKKSSGFNKCDMACWNTYDQCINESGVCSAGKQCCPNGYCYEKCTMVLPLVPHNY
jgi:hypothetical protein